VPYLLEYRRKRGLGGKARTRRQRAVFLNCHHDLPSVVLEYPTTVDELGDLGPRHMLCGNAVAILVGDVRTRVLI
jgi:hypothetical protein